MIDFSQISLSNAETVYLVANTPSFIVRKLSSDPAVHQIARNHGPEEIIESLQFQIDKAPTGARDS